MTDAITWQNSHEKTGDTGALSREQMIDLHIDERDFFAAVEQLGLTEQVTAQARDICAARIRTDGVIG